MRRVCASSRWLSCRIVAQSAYESIYINAVCMLCVATAVQRIVIDAQRAIAYGIYLAGGEYTSIYLSIYLFALYRTLIESIERAARTAGYGIYARSTLKHEVFVCCWYIHVLITYLSKTNECGLRLGCVLCVYVVSYSGDKQSRCVWSMFGGSGWNVYG